MFFVEKDGDDDVDYGLIMKKIDDLIMKFLLGILYIKVSKCIVWFYIKKNFMYLVFIYEFF